MIDSLACFCFDGEMPDDPDIADELAYMAAHPTMFTKAEMAEMIKAAEQVIRDLRILVGIRREIELEDAEPEGSA